ncbi:MAG: SDR family oxidoreductase [Thermoleophilaceae bacterium]
MTARVAVVTGAARNIGRAIAERFLADGANVVVCDVDAEAIDTTAAEIAPSEDRVLGHPADLSRFDGAEALVKAALERFGRVDALVNNAGGGVIRPFLQHDENSIQETLSRNLLTTIHCCRAVLPAMVEQSGGRIVNLGAESVRNGLWWHAMYNGAKGGVHGLTTGLAREFAPNGITVNCVAPSIVATAEVKEAMAAGDQLPAPMKQALNQTIGTIPAGRPATLEEVADVVCFLASEGAGFVTGQVISVNGGSSML